uniref:Small heat shock protein n=1 Tax=Venturia canescens TaxID=32260 RepID=Q5U8W2_9HYME|nr:small heat shock protein [Venturia canescens]
MSIVPLMFRDWWDDFDRPMSRLMDQHFGSGLNRADLLSGLSSLGLTSRTRPLFNNSYYRPWRDLVRSNSRGASTISCDNDRFEVILDVQQFSPEEISVKTIGNSVIVEAKHEEKQDEHGYISRHFVRRYVLPASHEALGVTSSLSSDGVLTITAPKKVRVQIFRDDRPELQDPLPWSSRKAGATRDLPAALLFTACFLVSFLFFPPLFLLSQYYLSILFPLFSLLPFSSSSAVPCFKFILYSPCTLASRRERPRRYISSITQGLYKRNKKKNGLFLCIAFRVVIKGVFFFFFFFFQKCSR